MKYKLEAFEKFKEFRIKVEKQLGKSIKTLRSDRGGEYLSQEFLDYLVEIMGYNPNGLHITCHNTMVWLKGETEPC